MTKETDTQIPKPTMCLKTRKHMYESIISPNCPASEALFELLAKKRLTHKELPLIGRMGFEVKLVGETSALSNEMYNARIDHERVLANRPMIYSLMDEDEF